MSNLTSLAENSKYAIRVTGLGTPLFDSIHITSLVCISLSFTSAVFVIISSFCWKDHRKFFKSWTQCERFCVYLAICDGLFNTSHFSDHFHMLLTRYHVTPLVLCEFYAFFVFEFITAQYFMVVIIAVNAFLLIKYKTRLNLGKKDWKFLLVSFGGPFILCCLAAALDQMGPVGSFCGISGRLANLFFSLVPQVCVLITCSVLYFVTWYHIYSETRVIQGSLGEAAQTSRSCRRAARNMTLFVMVFFIQYAPSGIASVIMMLGDVSPLSVPIILGFTNIGGFLNCIVYLIVRKRSSTVTASNRYGNTGESRRENFHVGTSTTKSFRTDEGNKERQGQ